MLPLRESIRDAIRTWLDEDNGAQPDDVGSLVDRIMALFAEPAPRDEREYLELWNSITGRPAVEAMRDVVAVGYARGLASVSAQPTSNRALFGPSLYEQIVTAQTESRAVAETLQRMRTLLEQHGSQFIQTAPEPAMSWPVTITDSSGGKFLDGYEAHRKHRNARDRLGIWLAAVDGRAWSQFTPETSPGRMNGLWTIKVKQNGTDVGIADAAEWHDAVNAALDAAERSTG